MKRCLSVQDLVLENQVQSLNQINLVSPQSQENQEKFRKVVLLQKWQHLIRTYKGKTLYFEWLVCPRFWIFHYINKFPLILNGENIISNYYLNSYFSTEGCLYCPKGPKTCPSGCDMSSNSRNQNRLIQIFQEN